MDKKKQIEEMAKAIQLGGCLDNDSADCDTCPFYQGIIIDGNNNDPHCVDYYTANSLYNAGYRKIPDGAVVLTQEEFDNDYVTKDDRDFWKSRYDILVSKAKLLIAQARKETAREIVSWIRGTKYSSRLWDELDLIAQRYGVEVE